MTQAQIVEACKIRSFTDELFSEMSADAFSLDPFKGLLNDADLLWVTAQFEEAVKKIEPEKRFLEALETPSVKVKPLSAIEESEVSWLIPGYIPRGSITVLGGDGSSGKTSLWCNLIGSITTGRRSIFEQSIPFGEKKPGVCMFFSSEDSVSTVLKRRLKKAGADETRTLLVDLADPNFSKIRFDSVELAELVRAYTPEIVVFDPLQSFLDPSIQMGSRAAMRNALNPLVGLGEKHGTCFLLIMHTNKRTGIAGRKRLADSADVWDIARSVLIAGRTQGNLFYCSHEKSNYGPLAGTILFSMDDGVASFKALTDKRDSDFVSEGEYSARTAPARTEAKELILETLRENESPIEVGNLDAVIKEAGVSFSSLKRAKAELKKDGLIQISSYGFGQTKKHMVSLVVK